MNGLFENKRALSPLIATIVLIGFSVVLGGGVMWWGEKYIEEKADFVSGNDMSRCDGVDFRILKLEGVSQVCQAGDVVRAWFDNGQGADIWDIQVRVIGSENTVLQTSLLFGPLVKGDAQKVEVPANDVGAIKQIKFTPAVKSGKDVVACEKKALTYEKISACKT